MNADVILQRAANEGVTMELEAGKLKLSADNPPTSALMELVKKNRDKIVSHLKPDLPKELWREGMTPVEARIYRQEMGALYKAVSGSRNGKRYVAAPGSGLCDVHYDGGGHGDEPSDVAPGVYLAAVGDYIHTEDISGRDPGPAHVHVGRQRGNGCLLYPTGTVAEYKKQLYKGVEDGGAIRQYMMFLASKVDACMEVAFSYDGEDEEGYADVAKRCLQWLVGVGNHG